MTTTATRRETADGLNLDAAMEQHDLAARSGGASAPHWMPLLGGALLTGYGLSRQSFGGALLALAGSGLAWYGMTGRTPLASRVVPDGSSSVRVEKSVTIARPPAEVYAEWQDVEQLPSIMSHLKSVTRTAGGKTHWVAKAPMGRTVEWDAEVIHDRDARIISWRSVGDTAVHNVGTVRFDPAPGGRGTELKVTIEYLPPAGALGATFAKLFGEEPGQQVADDLRRFKQYMETGEYPTTEGQPRGGASTSLMDAGIHKVRHLIEAADSAVSGPDSTP